MLSLITCIMQTSHSHTNAVTVHRHDTGAFWYFMCQSSCLTFPWLLSSLPLLSCFILGTAAYPSAKGVLVKAIASTVCAVVAVIATSVIAVIGFVLYRRKRRRSHEQYMLPHQLHQPLVSVRTHIYSCILYGVNGE